MSVRPTRSLIALASAAALCLSLAAAAVAHDEEASPAPAAEAATTVETEVTTERETELAERAEAREARQAERAERKAERQDRRIENAASRELRKAERSVEREERREARRAQRAERRAARAEVRQACAAELRAVRDADLDRGQQREAWRAARMSCREMYFDALESAAAGAIDARYSAAAADGTGVVRTDLGIAEPGSAPGQELGLWHYRIPAGTELVPHTHPGWQLARVTDGELEYTVIEGEGVLLRGEDSEPMGPGTYILAAGDGVIENPELVHEAANRTDEAVTIISATLYPAGADLSTLIGDPDQTAAEE